MAIWDQLCSDKIQNLEQITIVPSLLHFTSEHLKHMFDICAICCVISMSYLCINICSAPVMWGSLPITSLPRKVWNMQFISVCTECITLSQILVYHFCTEHKTTLNMIKHALSSSHQFAFNKKYRGFLKTQIVMSKFQNILNRLFPRHFPIQRHPVTCT